MFSTPHPEQTPLCLWFLSLGTPTGAASHSKSGRGAVVKCISYPLTHRWRKHQGRAPRRRGAWHVQAGGGPPPASCTSARRPSCWLPVAARVWLMQPTRLFPLANVPSQTRKWDIAPIAYAPHTQVCFAEKVSRRFSCVEMIFCRLSSGELL